MNAGRIELRAGQQGLRVGGKRVSQASNMELTPARLLFGDDDARLGFQPRHIGLPALGVALLRGRGPWRYRKPVRLPKVAGRRLAPGRSRRWKRLALGEDATVGDRKLTVSGGDSDAVSRFSTN